MKQMEESEETTKYIVEAEKVLQGIECKEEGEGGMVTRTMVRKIFEITESRSYREFKLRFRYAVARNIPKRAPRETQLERFYTNLISVAEKVEEANRLPHIRKLMEYVIMLHTVKTKLGE